MDMIQTLAQELNKDPRHVENVVRLLDEGNTIPFIARYRKELHGAMDDTSLRTLEERLQYLRGLEERRDTVKKSIEEQGKLTEELAAAIDSAQTLAEVEDLYRPYKQKRRTRATVARERAWNRWPRCYLLRSGTVPVRRMRRRASSIRKRAWRRRRTLCKEPMTSSPSGSATMRPSARACGSCWSGGVLCVPSPPRRRTAFTACTTILSSPSATCRATRSSPSTGVKKEEKLKVTVLLDRDLALPVLRRAVVKPGSAAMEFVKATAEDSYDRLIYPSLEREMRAALTDRADEGAIGQFALNLKPLLMQPPVKGKVTMGLDPGYRMGCKVAVVDGTGKVLDTAVVYPTYGERQKNEAIAALSKLIAKHGVEHIAIGNGTASRETEQMAVELIRQVNEAGAHVSYMIVSEAGASVYSASKLAAEEFPQYDVNLRSAVSIARRLQDPLAELVKIDPKSIGVGQYQHDCPQKRLDDALNGVVEDCVNAVGVDVNTASPSLLQRVAGLNGTTAKNVVVYREENGAFTSRAQIKKVPKLGPKAFQQCAGFCGCRRVKAYWTTPPSTRNPMTRPRPCWS